MKNLVAVYPGIAGSRIDDCRTCHKDGSVILAGKTVQKNACDFCHYIPFPDKSASGQPTMFAQTLNLYGLAYKVAGRTKDALRSISDADSDGDGCVNRDEIHGRYLPGNKESRPGLPEMATKVLTVGLLRSMPVHSQFLLANAHKEHMDYYGTYRGVTVQDLLAALGVDIKGVTGITVMSADGYRKDLGVDAIAEPYPKGRFYSGLDAKALGAKRAFVKYPRRMPEGLSNGGEIPGEQRLLLAYERDGMPLDTSRLDPVSRRMEGEGPVRLVVPQTHPGPPDRGSAHSPSGYADGNDFDASKDHNAGLMVRGVVAIRINPAPEGYQEFDYMNGGWACINRGQVIAYGKGIK
jgi:hypothetical protein